MKHKKSDILKNNLPRIAKIHFALIIIYIVQVIVYDASKLITPDVVLNRWLAAGGLAIVTTIVLYMARGKTLTQTYTSALVGLLIIADIAFAVFNVYTQRGMSSRAVLLFLIPIIISATLKSKVALFSTAILCVVAYTTTAVAYFVNYFNEGYKVELYGEILFYSSMFLVAAALLWSVIKTKRTD